MEKSSCDSEWKITWPGTTQRHSIYPLDCGCATVQLCIDCALTVHLWSDSFWLILTQQGLCNCALTVQLCIDCALLCMTVHWLCIDCAFVIWLILTHSDSARTVHWLCNCALLCIDCALLCIDCASTVHLTNRSLSLLFLCPSWPFGRWEFLVLEMYIRSSVWPRAAVTILLSSSENLLTSSPSCFLIKFSEVQSDSLGSSLSDQSYYIQSQLSLSNRL